MVPAPSQFDSDPIALAGPGSTCMKEMVSRYKPGALFYRVVGDRSLIPETCLGRSWRFGSRIADSDGTLDERMQACIDAHDVEGAKELGKLVHRDLQEYRQLWIAARSAGILTMKAGACIPTLTQLRTLLESEAEHGDCHEEGTAHPACG